MKECKEKGLRGVFCKSGNDTWCELESNIQERISIGMKLSVSEMTSYIKKSGCANKAGCIDLLRKQGTKIRKDRTTK